MNTNTRQAGSCPGRCRASYAEVMADVYMQIEADCFPTQDLKIVENIARIITEVYQFPDELEIQIGKEKHRVDDVRAVYEQLEAENVMDVIASFRAIKHKIQFPKTYFRTALYNSVLEYAIKSENEIKSS